MSKSLKAFTIPVNAFAVQDTLKWGAAPNPGSFFCTHKKNGTKKKRPGIISGRFLQLASGTCIQTCLPTGRLAPAVLRHAYMLNPTASFFHLKLSNGI